MNTALERAKQKIQDEAELAYQRIRDEAQWKTDELERLSVLAEELGLAITSKDECAVTDVAKLDPQIGRVRRHKQSWTKTLVEVADKFPKGASRADLKDALADTHLGPRLKETEAAFYGSIAKLLAKGELMERNGYLFTPSLCSRFEHDVKLGIVEDNAPISSSRVSNVSTVIDFLSQIETADAGSVFEAIKTNSDVQMKNKNSVYNLLARMVKNGDIVKEGTMYRLPFDENGLLTGKSDEKAEHDEDMFGFQNPNTEPERQ